jgi:hypothetical protein
MKMKNAACMGWKSLLQTTLGTLRTPKILWVAIFDHKIQDVSDYWTLPSAGILLRGFLRENRGANT